MDPEHAHAPAGRSPRGVEIAALLLALIASAGSVWLSMGLGLKACPLCFYQRSFVFGVAAVLLMGLFAGLRPGLASMLALPLGTAGFSIAAYHNLLELRGKLECPEGLAGLGTAPQQSLAALALVLALLVAAARMGARREGRSVPAILAGGIIIGALGGALSVASSPPMAAPPAKPHETPLDICRPPFRPPA